MINFFRKTRKKLADDNKLFKYSRYAIGEIVLVVIGILIALSINNWNNQRLFDKALILQLKLLSKEMANDIEEFDKRIEEFPPTIDYLQKLSKGEYEELDLSQFYNIVALNDTPIIFGESYTILKNNGGINQISNDTLKSELRKYHDLYRVNHGHNIEYGALSALSFIDETVLSYMEYDDENKLVRENTINVIKERKLNNIINLQLERFNYHLQFNKGLSNYSKELKKMLDQYIDEKE